MWLIEFSRAILSAISSTWDIILSWLNTSLADVVNVASAVPVVGTVVEWLLGLVHIPIDGVSYSLADITVLELVLGFGLPVFLAFTFVKWILNLVT